MIYSLWNLKPGPVSVLGVLELKIVVELLALPLELRYLRPYTRTPYIWNTRYLSVGNQTRHVDGESVRPPKALLQSPRIGTDGPALSSALVLRAMDGPEWQAWMCRPPYRNHDFHIEGHFSVSRTVSSRRKCISRGLSSRVGFTPLTVLSIEYHDGCDHPFKDCSVRKFRS